MMRAMPYNLQQGKVSQILPKWKSLDKFQHEEEQLQVFSGDNSSTSKISKKNSNNNSSRTTSSVESEPTSTLDTPRRSSSPPTSTSTLSSAVTGGFRGKDSISDNNAAGVAVDHGGDGGGSGGGIGLEEWESLFPNGDGSLLPWIMGDPDDPGLGLKNLLQSGNPFEGNVGLGVVNPNQERSHHFESNAKNGGGGGLISPNCFSTNGFDLNPGQLQFQQKCEVVSDENPQILNPQLVMNQQQAHIITNPSFLMSPATLGNYCQQLEQFQPQVKRPNPDVVLDPNLLQGSKNPFLDPGHHEMLFRKQHQQPHMGLPPQLFPQQLELQEQGVKDLLFKAADMIQTGNFSLAQEILARLNHQLLFLAKPPLVRAALYAKEALQMLLQLNNPVAASPSRMLTPYEVVHKMNAYKVFSEVSPVTQFVNFTCTQAILEALDDDVHAIHIVDFDIGCGAQWASLIQELPLRKRGAPSLHITAIAPPITHSFELALIRENLVQFANDAGVAFELQVVNLDSFDTSSSSLPNFRTSEDECIAVSIPIWSSSTRPSLLPLILRLIKEHSPKIVVSLDEGFDRCDVPFPQHLMHSLESCTNLLESLDGLNVTSDIVSKIEKYLVKLRLENSVLGRLHAPNKIPHWKNLFASAGLVPLQFSNFTETQADYVVKRSPGRGFHVEKRQASLVLSWQRRELVSASAWRC